MTSCVDRLELYVRDRLTQEEALQPNFRRNLDTVFSSRGKS
jgi:hypothetical protein